MREFDGQPTEVTVTEAARNFGEIVDRAHYRGERFILTKGGKAVVEMSPLRMPPLVTAADLRQTLKGIRHLGKVEAEAFDRDLDEARRSISEPGGDPWESSSTARS
jgi:antitoxin (DNA-binding transcriptional repressor) of toxin-antitoxin stability system